MKINRIWLNGPVIQGISMPGVIPNGTSITGARATQFSATTLPSGETMALR